MKPTCTKVKNPCKFCLQQVTNKNGLQCQGACKKWAHFKCLNYTPGKISDIKAGIIKVTCPCPDCDTSQPKEFLTNPPFTCSNNACPANKSPKCESIECPKNVGAEKATPIPAIPIKTSSGCLNSTCSKEAIPCPNADCLVPQKKRKSHPKNSPPRSPTPPKGGTPKGKLPESPPGCGKSKKDPCVKDGKNAKKSSNKNSPKNSTKFVEPPCPNECGSGTPPKGKNTKKKKEKKKSSFQKSPSCSLLSSDLSTACKQFTSSSSDSRLGSPKKHQSMEKVLLDMCTTVGKLSVQLKELMCKMMQT